MAKASSENDSVHSDGKLTTFVHKLRERLDPESRQRRSLRDAVPYDPETQYPVIRASICTGERVAGFKDKRTGHFVEVMLIRSSEDERRFMEAYEIETLQTEY